MWQWRWTNDDMTSLSGEAGQFYSGTSRNVRRTASSGRETNPLRDRLIPPTTVVSLGLVRFIEPYETKPIGPVSARFQFKGTVRARRPDRNLLVWFVKHPVKAEKEG